MVVDGIEPRQQGCDPRADLGLIFPGVVAKLIARTRCGNRTGLLDEFECIGDRSFGDRHERPPPMVISCAARFGVCERQRGFVGDSGRFPTGLVLHHLVDDGRVQVAGRQEGMVRATQLADSRAEHGLGLDEEVHEPLELRIVGGGVFHGVAAAGRGDGHATGFGSEA